MPDVMNLKKISGPVYEAYVPIAEESFIKKYFVTDMIKHKMNEFRTRNFFVKRIYTKYQVISNGVTIIAFELVRLREPIIERLRK